MTFNPITEPIDYILLSGKRSPGLAVINNANTPRRWDERRGYALSGSRVVFRGIGLSRPIVTLTLVSEQDFLDWAEWRLLVQRPPVGERRSAQDIWHPILEDLGVRSVVVEDVLQPKQSDNGVWTIDIKFIEFRRPVFTLEPIGDSAAAEPLSRNQKVISNLNSQVQALSP